MEKIILLGCGGHAKSIVDAIKESNLFEVIGFIDVSNTKEFCGYPVLGNDDCLPKIFADGVENAFVCVGSAGETSPRIKLYNMLKKVGFKIPNIFSSSSILAQDIMFGEGVFVGKGAIVNSSSQIKNMTIINTGAIVEHDCYVGEFAHISPGAVLCGNVEIGDSTHIGANATVIQGLKIASKTIIGAGSVVTHSILKSCVAYGNPCKEV